MIGEIYTVCNADGNWSSIPTCLRDCGSPKPENGQSSTPTGTTLGEAATISCNEGYTVSGSIYIICNDAGWNDTTNCTIQECDDPSPINGLASLPSGKTYDNTAVISCNDGYKLVGNELIVCIDGPKWSSSPTCVKDCGDPSPMNGVATFNSGTTLNQTASVTCNTGYNLTGPDSLTCTSDGWDANVTCTIQDCGQLSVPNGFVEAPGGTEYEKYAFVICNVGYQLAGSMFIICQNGPSWSDIPTCDIKDCGDPTPVNGSVSDSTTTYGANVTVTCDNGYDLSASAEITCQADGTWNDIPTCVENDCGRLSIANANVTVSDGTLLGASATVACNDGYTLNGQTQSVCLSTGWDPVASCDIIDCFDVSIEHGTASFTTGTTYGGLAFISCDFGYVMIGEIYTVCNADGNWSSIPTCLRDCGSPKPENGQSSTPTGTTLGEAATISCNEGYTVSGSIYIICNDAGWNDTTNCTIQECDDPSPINGLASLPSGKTYDNTAVISCNDGYKLVGNELIVCIDGPKWSSSPTCVKDCGDPSPMNGVATFNSGTTLNQTASVTCNTGYNLTGPDSLTCTSDGWDANVTCTIQDCGQLSVPNGFVDAPGGTEYEKYAFVICNVGYQLAGSMFIICQNGPSWSDIPTCDIKDCGDPTPVNGSVSDSTTTYGANVTVTCDNGYDLSASAEITCQADGTWNDIPTCVENDCGRLSIANANVTVSDGTLLGASATVACNDGYTLNGQTQSVCLSTGWDPVASCDIIDCFDVSIEHGTASLTTGTTYGGLAFISCDFGYVMIGEIYTVCNADGNWSSIPTCLRDCGSPKPENGQSSTPTGTTLGEAATISCNEGYTVSGSIYIICNDAGWNDTTNCTIQECDDPSPINGLASLPSGKTYDNTAVISCNDGYKLVGNELIVCIDGPKWSSSPTCVKDCGDPSPMNGVATFNSGTTLNQTASVTCNTGYNLTGPDSLTCTSDGWDANVTCTIQDCGQLSVPNGFVEAPGGTEYEKYAFVICNVGYQLAGSMFIICQNGPSWSDIPTCDIKDCGDPTPVNGSVSDSTTTYGANVTVTCDNGYDLSASAEITCQADGTWNDIPTCVENDCGRLSIANANVTVSDGTLLGASATVACNDGYTLNGQTQSVCLSTGWDPVASCDIIDCFDVSIEHGTASLTTGTTYGGLAFISCDFGYVMIGEIYTVCNADGNWSSIPTCLRDCGSPKPENGQSSTPTGTTLGEAATISCNEGYTVSGSIYIICNDAGWNDTTNCTIQECDDPSPINGLASLPSGKTYDNTAVISCNDGYKLVGNELIVCIDGPKWSSSPTCVKDCGDPSPMNGVATFNSGTTLNQTASVTCNTGYNLTGPDSLTCTSDGWDANVTCTIQDCGQLSVPNGFVEAPGGTEYEKYAFVICNVGYQLAGSMFIICQNGPSWSDIPTCDIKDCGDPTPVNGSVSDSTTTYGANVTVTCDNGYDLSASAEITCQADGTWNDIPTCVENDCGRLSIANANVTVSDGTLLGASATVACNDGYTLNGQTQSVCLSTGWDPVASCDIIDCYYVSIEHGTASLTTGTTYGGLAFISCDFGYVMIGEIYTVCNADGNWSSIPTCLRDCGSPKPENGQSSTPTGTTLGEAATISCNEGYTVSGSIYIICNDAGWNDTTNCTIQECDDPSPINGLASLPSGKTYDNTAVISCNDGYKLVGNELIVCIDGPKWSSSPTCVKDCGDPSPENGDALTSGGTIYGQTATLACNSGYDISGASVLICELDGWNDTATCTIQECSDPSPQNGTALYPKGKSFGEVAYVSCDDGYILQGDEQLTCLAGPLWNTIPECLKDCGDPAPVNGFVMDFTGTTFGQTATVGCNSGYNISGPSSLTCSHNGWSDAPTCDLQDCGSLVIANGTVESPRGSKYGEVAIVSCDVGFERSGSSFITCGNGPYWSDIPDCTIKDCGDFNILLGHVNSSETVYGSVLAVTCDTGHVISGPSVVSCTADGSWSYSPTCSPDDCGQLSIPNANVSIPYGTVYGANATIYCHEGFDLDGPPYLECLLSGWSASSSCLIQDCGNPSPANGIAELPKGSTYDEIAIISCYEGYKLIGHSHIVCTDGPSWSSLPTCLRDCGDPTPLNGFADTSLGTTENLTATITCNPGYNISGPSVITCQDSGWDTLPTCVIQDCGDPSPANGSANNPKGTTYGEVALIVCDEGFVINGQTLITCNPGSTWSSYPKCVSIDCDDPAPVHGQSDTPEGTTLGSVAGVSCDTGYDLIGDTIITCELGPTWSVVPQCIRNCGTPSIQLGTVTPVNGTLFQAVANVLCNVGYENSGIDTQFTCEHDGWTGNAKCEILDCGNPTPSNGTSTLPDGTEYGAIAIINCDEGFRLLGDTLIKCLATGEWSEAPTCVTTSTSPESSTASPETQTQTDSTFNFETTLIFGLILGLFVLITVIIAAVCWYTKRCKQSKGEPERINENEFAGHEPHGDWSDDDDFYPPDLLTHPPPNSREALPPMFFSHKSNVNVVPPMTKKSVPDDVKAAAGTGSQHPTPSKIFGKRKGLPPVPSDVRQMHDNFAPLPGGNVSPIERMPITGEINAPVDEIEEPNRTNKPLEVNTLSTDLERGDSSVILTTASVETQRFVRENNPKTTPIKQAGAKPSEKVKTARKNLQTSTKPKNIIKTATKVAIPTKVKAQKKTDVDKSTKKNEPRDTIIDIEGSEKPHLAASIVIPANDVHNEHFPSGTPPLSPKPPTPLSDPPVNNQTPVFTKCDTPETIVSHLQNTPDESIKLTDGADAFYDLDTSKVKRVNSARSKLSISPSILKQADDKPPIAPSLQISTPTPVSTPTPIQKVGDKKHLRVPTPEASGLNDAPRIQTQIERIGLSRTASISSKAPQTMPSVENVLLVEPTSSSNSDKGPDSDNYPESKDESKDNYSYSDTFSSSTDIEMAAPKPKKNFLFEEPDPFKSIPVKHDTSRLLQHDHVMDKISPERTPKSSKSTAGPRRTEASSRLLTSSYGPRTESVKVYNPGTEKKTKESSKTKEKKKLENELRKAETKRKRNVRMNAMSTVYGKTHKVEKPPKH
ncbi:sushi, von Willebrand factor type A, EGF and pentraxin domain-containing protein 1-like [Mya arenaria]|uniref:sushi, von Willebrand factor type A, EGF and pentraxin domain-containing protein 1-like n=1 Tax=Mya arenaria TaxID=6604 RepID=UPI0022E1D2E6|nr:sushi, von Willebrand factor type A, EGF and pentraxin domain-containing protein 1-like [Mya arenaria]